jgi:hypothetical protein
LKTRNALIWFAILAAILVFLNLLTFLGALPETSGTQLLCFSNLCTNAGRDFSAYYEAGYRFLYNPTMVYSNGTVALANGTVVTAQVFRYSPFFLPLFIVPLVLFFDYTHALKVFDLIQFLLLPLMGYLLYKIMMMTAPTAQTIEKRTFAFFSLTLVITILEPFGLTHPNITFWSWSYSRLWMEGEARVLQTMLILLTLYLVLKSSKFSGIPLVLSSFDPRMSILSLPLLVYLAMRRKTLGRFARSALGSFGVLYTPTMLYANLGIAFLGTVFIKDFVIYAYEWVPLLTIISLTGTIFASEFIPRLEIMISNCSLIGMLKSKLGGIPNFKPIPYSRNTISLDAPSIHWDFRYVPSIRTRYGI